MELAQHSGFRAQQDEVQKDAASCEAQLSRIQNAQELRAHTALAENLSLDPNTYVRQPTNACNSSPGFIAFPCTSQHLASYALTQQGRLYTHSLKPKVNLKK